MYHAAAQLDPQDVYDVARMAFLEMVLSGTTTVGEFHYLHNAPGGRPYDDPNLLSKQVIAAAQSVGIRIVLLRRRICDRDTNCRRIRARSGSSSLPQFLDNMEALRKEYPSRFHRGALGVAPHSLRAVPLRELKEIAAWTRERKLPLHMHVAEQIAENEACLREYGLTPVALLGREGLLGPTSPRCTRSISPRMRSSSLPSQRHRVLMPHDRAQPWGRRDRRRPGHARRASASRWARIARRRSIRWRMRASSNTTCGSIGNNAPSWTRLESRRWPRASLTAPRSTEPCAWRPAGELTPGFGRLLHRGSG
jgi:hypothetical protein